MANFRPLSFSMVSLLLLASLIMADGGGAEDQQAEGDLLEKCPLDGCRFKVSNKQCCSEIEKGIKKQQGCGCVCHQLKQYGAPNLTIACYNSTTCPKCKQCVCSTKPLPLRGTVG